MANEIVINEKTYRIEIEIDGEVYFLIYEPFIEGSEENQRFTHAYVLKSQLE